MHGLIESYGPYSVCEWQPGGRELETEARAKLLARQGVGMLSADRLRVVDKKMDDVAADAETMGKIVMRGNNVMNGYFADEEATAEAFRGGWLRSGDLGVMNQDGYVELRDRAKDVVISGGENICTVEVASTAQRRLTTERSGAVLSKVAPGSALSAGDHKAVGRGVRGDDESIRAARSSSRVDASACRPSRTRPLRTRTKRPLTRDRLSRRSCIRLWLSHMSGCRPAGLRPFRDGPALCRV
jgi:hypothetical protein